MTRRFFYLVHGVRLGSEHPLVGVPDARLQSGEMDLTLSLYRFTEAEARALCSQDAARLSMATDVAQDDAPFVIESASQTHRLRIALTRSGSRIEVGWWDANSPGLDGLHKIFTTYLLGHLVAVKLRLLGKLVLHGNAVRIGGTSIAWVGNKEAGKSTLAAAFVDAGCALVTDDQLVLREADGDWLPAYGVPRVRLWPRSVAGLSTPTITGVRQPFGAHRKGWMEVPPDLSDGGLANPLAAIYVLGPRRPELDGSAITSLAPGVRLQNLLAHRLWQSSLPMTADQRSSEFQMLGRLVARVPVYSLEQPDRLDALPATVRLLTARHSAGAVSLP